MPDRARGMQRVIRYCDGWLPNAGLGMDLPKQILELHHLAEQAGRDPKDDLNNRFCRTGGSQTAR
jgi:hypothetical protein